MAFLESNEAPGGPAIVGPLGLPVNWSALRSKSCPRCSHELQHFSHVKRWTCYDCGIKIPDQTMLGTSRGYFIGLTQFKDEVPF